MNKILINGVNTKAGGGKSILVNYLILLKNEKQDFYYFTSPDDEEFEKYETSHLKLIRIPSLLKESHLIIFTYYFLLRGDILNTKRLYGVYVGRGLFTHTHQLNAIFKFIGGLFFESLKSAFFIRKGLFELFLLLYKFHHQRYILLIYFHHQKQ